MQKYLIPPLAALAISLPFIYKAFHIDDALFIYMARQIIKNPIDPYSFFVNWDYVTERAFDFFSNPPGIGYFLAFIIYIFGENEVALHGSYILFTLISGFSISFIARRFTNNPYTATLLLFFSPIFMITSHNIMPDMPLLSVYMLSLAIFIYASESENLYMLFISGFFAGVAILFRYNGISILSLMFFYHTINFGIKKRKNFIVFLPPLLMLFAWCAISSVSYGEVHLIKHMKFQQYGQEADVIKKKLFFLANFLYLSGGSIFPVFLLSTLFLSWKRNRYLLLLLLFVCSILFFFYKESIFRLYNIQNITLMSALFFCILYFLVSSVKELVVSTLIKNEKWRDDLFLILWIFIIVMIQTSGIHTSAKYMILALPPLLLLFVRSLPLETITKAKQKIILSIIFVFSAAWGFLNAAADYELADINRDIATYCKENFNINENSTLWFLGHWGFQYYMENNGYQAYEAQSDLPKKGDILVRSSLAWPQSISNELNSRIILENKISINGKLPIKIMHNKFKSQANFYATENFMTDTQILQGILPLSISNGSLDDFFIYSVGQ